MSLRVAAHLVIGLVLLSLAGTSAYATDPLTQVVAYRIHEDPNDANSPIVFSVTLFLQEQQSNNNATGWKITGIRFRQPGQSGGADHVWEQSDPNVPTQSGLWWIVHGNRQVPQLAEFAMPPHLVGTATAQDPNQADLNYDFVGISYTPPPGGPPWNPTAALTYEFTPVGESIPLVDGEQKPVGVDSPEDEPPISGS